MRRFVLGWKKLGREKRLGAYIVNYADDFAICCRGRAEEALSSMRVMMAKLKLTANEKKTRVSKLPEDKFDFWVIRSAAVTRLRRDVSILARFRPRSEWFASVGRSAAKPGIIEPCWTKRQWRQNSTE
jgi:hypothetical protein